MISDINYIIHANIRTIYLFLVCKLIVWILLSNTYYYVQYTCTYYINILQLCQQNFREKEIYTYTPTHAKSKAVCAQSGLRLKLIWYMHVYNLVLHMMTNSVSPKLSWQSYSLMR